MSTQPQKLLLSHFNRTRLWASKRRFASATGAFTSNTQKLNLRRKLRSSTMNRLYFGDNLAWLRNTKEFPDASVDLVYLDPPFNSNADYNVLFREASGQASQAQFHAFTDTWTWADAAETYHQFIDTCRNVPVVEIM